MTCGDLERSLLSQSANSSVSEKSPCMCWHAWYEGGSSEGSTLTWKDPGGGLGRREAGLNGTVPTTMGRTMVPGTCFVVSGVGSEPRALFDMMLEGGPLPSKVT